MNRKKKLYQKVKKKLMQAKAKKQPVKKDRYIAKADRLDLDANESETLTQQSGNLNDE